MKSKLKFLITILALGLTGVSLSRAADEATPPPADAPKAKHGDRGDMRANIQARLKELSETLALTDEQKAKITDILKANAEEFKDARGDRAKMGELLKAQREQLRAVLTPEQQTKFDAMKSEHHDGAKGKGKKAE